jgi:hypothetical protein
MTSVIATLKSLYSTPNRHRTARATTLAPLATRVHAVRTDLAALIAAHADVARKAATLNARALGRYVRPDLVPVVNRLIAMADLVKNHGDTRDVLDALHLAEDTIDTAADREWELSAQNVEKFLARTEGALAALQQAAASMIAALRVLEAEESLANDAVVVPPMVEQFR